MTNTEVTDESVTAFAQYCQVLSDVTRTNTEVTDESATAVAQFVELLSDVTLTNTEGTEEFHRPRRRWHQAQVRRQ